MAFVGSTWERAFQGYDLRGTSLWSPGVLDFIWFPESTDTFEGGHRGHTGRYICIYVVFRVQGFQN